MNQIAQCNLDVEAGLRIYINIKSGKIRIVLESSVIIWKNSSDKQCINGQESPGKQYFIFQDTRGKDYIFYQDSPGKKYII